VATKTITIMYQGYAADGVYLDTGQHLLPGEPVDVDADVAGRAPDGDDPGEGLLAQTGNFVAVTVKGRKAKEDESNG
jgi:hypothetical protein